MTPHSNEFGFDAVGSQVLQLDELGNPAYFTYDDLKRLTEVKDAAFKATTFEYDTRSEPTKRVDALGDATYMAYDAAGRLQKKWFAASGTAESHVAVVCGAVVCGAPRRTAGAASEDCVIQSFLLEVLGARQLEARAALAKRSRPAHRAAW